jgi:hypothetical protein
MLTRRCLVVEWVVALSGQSAYQVVSGMHYMWCSVGSAAERPERSRLASKNFLVLVPTDPDFIPPAGTHGRAAELLRV